MLTKISGEKDFLRGTSATPPSPPVRTDKSVTAPAVTLLAAAVPVRGEGAGAACRSLHTGSERGSHSRAFGHQVTRLGALRGARSGLAARGGHAGLGEVCVTWVLLF